jgi:hypothetical protein
MVAQESYEISNSIKNNLKKFEGKDLNFLKIQHFKNK